MTDTVTDDDRNKNMVPWAFRRRAAISVMTFAAGACAYAIFKGPELATVVLTPMVSLVTLVLSAYGITATYADTRG